MFLLEHDAKTLLAATGARVPDGVLLTSSDITSDDLPAPGPWVVKAQVTAGGRGKAGGIALADTPDAVQREAQRILGLEIKGKKVDSVRIEKQVSGASEHYLGFILDPGASGVQVLFSAEGGVDIEDGADQLRSTIAAPNEAAMVKAAVELSADQSDALRTAIADATAKLAPAFLRFEAVMLEINPLFVLPDGSWVAGDAKMVIDENALFRQPEVSAFIDARGDVYRESQIKRDHGFDYVQIDPNGEIGLLTTGAGLSMMLIDELTGAGLKPYNFLDLRSGGLRGDPSRIIQVMNWMADGPKVGVVLVNIFAGVTHLGEFTELLLQAFKETPRLKVPVVARLVGNGLDEARAIIEKSGEPITLEPDLAKAIALASSHLGKGAVSC
ncbi:MAG: succinyl-CoA synthetase beta subunit [Alphaproteobacteria bacterium]|jgi:succinyl-CoA synthetase beta subunit